MTKNTLFVLFMIFSFAMNAQSYIGFLTDNYSGVNSVISNPANITDSRFKTDINLVGISGFFSNDYFSGSSSDAFSDDFDYDNDVTLSPSISNNFTTNIDIMGPAFMFNLNRNSSLAVFTRARTFVSANDINGETIDELDEGIDENRDFIIDEGDFYTTATGWTEIGLTYARTLMNKQEHYLKGGLSIKYLRGYGNAYATGTNVTIDYDADGATLPNSTTVGTLESTGSLTVGRTDDYDDEDYEFESPTDASGFGVDLGFVYEWRPEYEKYKVTDANGEEMQMKYKNKYKLKLGLSVSDLGSINYKEGLVDIYDIANTITEDDFDAIEDIDGLQNLYTFTQSQEDIKVSLPTAIHFNADWNIHNGFYLNLNTDFSLSAPASNIIRVANIVSLTPRFESKWFSFYLPLSNYQYSGFHIGAGLRAGPLYIGSGSLISTFTKDKSMAADLYAGLKIPVYQGAPKDKDGDGVINKLDECPKTAGPAENNGCPWGDADEDSVLDNEDKCVNEAGPVENDGCPWVDTDGDSLLDNVDGCIDQAGPADNNGCPWPDTDGDSVLDKDDECPNEKGTVLNKGCPEPEVTDDVQKSLNEYARTILFNSGRATIKDGSISALTDIIGILTKYPNSKFIIEGHTDSIGSVRTNQVLSESRAKSVLNFLIKNGVDSSRLSSVGYGESRPIATNMYNSGRQKNRRVEINLVK